MSDSSPGISVDYLLGASALSWAILGLREASEAGAVSAPRLVMSALHICVGVLILLRSSKHVPGSLRSWLMCVPSLLAAGFALKVAPHPRTWAMTTQILFVAGGILTLSSFVNLGSSFSVMPSLRQIRVHGCYRWLRHPAYLGELVMVAACCSASGEAVAILPVLCAVAFLVLRIRAEEELLSASGDYQRYQERVRWRLVPLLW